MELYGNATAVYCMVDAYYFNPRDAGGALSTRSDVFVYRLHCVLASFVQVLRSTERAMLPSVLLTRNVQKNANVREPSSTAVDVV